jgi:hypothetical protein
MAQLEYILTKRSKHELKGFIFGAPKYAILFLVREGFDFQGYTEFMKALLLNLTFFSINFPALTTNQ